MRNVIDLMRSGDYAAALAAVEPELTGASRKAALTLKMQILMRSDRAAAEDTIRDLLGEGEPTAQTHANLAAVLLAHRRYDEAVEEGRRAIAIDPTAIAARKRLIATLQRTRRDAEALAVVNEGVALHPDDESLVDLRTQIEARMPPVPVAETPPAAETAAATPDVSPDLPKRKKKKLLRASGKKRTAAQA